MRLNRALQLRGLRNHFFGRDFGLFQYRFFAAENHPRQQRGQSQRKGRNEQSHQPSPLARR